MLTSPEVKAGMKSSLRSHVRTLSCLWLGFLLSAMFVGLSVRFVIYSIVRKPFLLWIIILMYEVWLWYYYYYTVHISYLIQELIQKVHQISGSGSYRSSVANACIQDNCFGRNKLMRNMETPLPIAMHMDGVNKGTLVQFVRNRLNSILINH